MKVESVAIVFLVFCLFLSFYFTFLSFQTADDALKKQLVTLAAYSLITGVVMLACLTISLGIKKAFPRVDSTLRGRSERSEQEE